MPLTREHSVFILGAGCSKSAGAPLMDEFLDEARNLYFTIDDKEDRGSFDRVFEAISHFSRVHSKAQLNLVNLETVFSAFEMARLLGKMPGDCSKDVDRLIRDLKRLIVVTLERSITPKSSGSAHISPDDEYANLAYLLYQLRGSGRRSAVITFNYDVLCDFAFNNRGLNRLYCLEGSDEDRGTEPKLLKLHGSLNWAVRDDKIEPQRVIVDQFHASSGKKNIRLTTDPAIGPETTQFDPSPFLVPPTWNKGDHYVSIQPVWRAAAQELAQANNIFVVGFSMPDTDSFFHYLYALGAESLEQLQRFFVFNPDEKVMGRFRRLLGPGALDRFKPYFRDKEGRFENAVFTMAKELGVSF